MQKSDWDLALVRCSVCNSVKKMSIENSSEYRITFCRVCGKPTLMERIKDLPKLTTMPHFDFKVPEQNNDEVDMEDEELKNKSEELKKKIHELVKEKIEKINLFFQENCLFCTQTYLKIEEASEVFKEYGLDDNISCVLCFNYAGWSFWFYYKGISCDAQNYQKNKVYLLQLLLDCVEQGTSSPNKPKDSTSNEEDKNPNNRVFGMLPMNKITIHKEYQTENGKITIDAGQCGWTVTYPDYSSVWKDVEDTDENNFNSALLFVKSEHKECVEIGTHVNDGIEK